MQQSRESKHVLKPVVNQTPEQADVAPEATVRRSRSLSPRKNRSECVDSEVSERRKKHRQHSHLKSSRSFSAATPTSTEIAANTGHPSQRQQSQKKPHQKLQQQQLEISESMDFSHHTIVSTVQMRSSFIGHSHLLIRPPCISQDTSVSRLSQVVSYESDYEHQRSRVLVAYV